MARQTKVLAVKAEDVSSIPRTHVVGELPCGRRYVSCPDFDISAVEHLQEGSHMHSSTNVIYLFDLYV